VLVRPPVEVTKCGKVEADTSASRLRTRNSSNEAALSNRESCLVATTCSCDLLLSLSSAVNRICLQLFLSLSQASSGRGGGLLTSLTVLDWISQGTPYHAKSSHKDQTQSLKIFLQLPTSTEIDLDHHSLGQPQHLPSLFLAHKACARSTTP